MNIKLQRYYEADARKNLEFKPRFPVRVNVICVTMRPHLIDEIIAKINSQTVKIHTVSFITQDFSLNDKHRLRTGITNGTVTIQDIPSDIKISLGERHNRAMDAIDSGITAIMDDDDYYAPNYLRGQVNTLIRKRVDLVNKADAIVTNVTRSRTGWISPFRPSDRLSIIGPGGSLVFAYNLYRKIRFADVQSGYDAIMQQHAYVLGLKVASSDPFNFAVVRGLSDHTWADSANVMELGLRINDIDFKDVAL
jgi:hypothetical protein